jgi:glycosyltransferase involved in cell wall biosynthesis
MAVVPEHLAELVAPVAVRVLDLDGPLDDLDLSYDELENEYRSLIAVGRLADEPIGMATFHVGPDGIVPRDELAGGLHRQLETELIKAYARMDRERNGEALSDSFDLEDEMPGMPLPSVSVVVTTRRDGGQPERCLRSILACDYDDLEVIVVENKRRSSATARMLVERFPDERRLRYVEEPRRSTSLARNAGLARAEGEIVAFVDDDVVVDSLWLRASVDALLSNRTIGCVTGLILPSKLESRNELRFEQVAAFGKGFQRRIYRRRHPSAQTPFVSYAASVIGSGGGMVMHTDLARELGGFDAALGPGTPAAGGHELDLSARVVRAGRAHAYEPRAIAWRNRRGGAGRPRRQAYRCGVGLGVTFAKQLIGGPARGDLLRAAPAALRHPLDPGLWRGGEQHTNGASRQFLRANPPGPSEQRDAGSRPQSDRRARYPRHLRWLRRLGMLVGPIAYLLSALIVRTQQLLGRQQRSPRPLRLVRRVVVGDESVNVAWFTHAPAPRMRFAWSRNGKRDAGGPLLLRSPARAVAIPPPATTPNGALRISAVVPTRNAEAWIESCVRSIRDNGAAEVILVDGGSTDRTVELARPWVDAVIDDGGAGVAAARMLGVISASEPWIALVDADVVLPPNALRELDRERHHRGLGALQAGLRSVGAGDYWSKSLADHHNSGQSKRWFGVCASLIARDVLLAYPLDAQLRSGEDIDLRIRLNRAGCPIGVSDAVISEHRFGDGFAFARDQWVADGAGLGRMVRKHGRAALLNAMIPFGAAALGIVRGMGDTLRPWPYFVGFAMGNYVGLWRGLLDRSVPVARRGYDLLVAGLLVWLMAMPLIAAAAAAALVLLMTHLGHAAYEGHLLLATLAILAVAIPLEVARGAPTGRFSAVARRLAPLTALAMAIGLILSGVRLARVVGL